MTDLSWLCKISGVLWWYLILQDIGLDSLATKSLTNNKNNGNKSASFHFSIFKVVKLLWYVGVCVTWKSVRWRLVVFMTEAEAGNCLPIKPSFSSHAKPAAGRTTLPRTLHTGNLLPSACQLVVTDISPNIIFKLGLRNAMDGKDYYRRLRFL